MSLVAEKFKPQRPPQSHDETFTRDSVYIPIHATRVNMAQTDEADDIVSVILYALQVVRL